MAKRYIAGMVVTTKIGSIALLLLLAACSDERPAAPTAKENQQLDEAEGMLNEAGSANAAR